MSVEVEGEGDMVVLKGPGDWQLMFTLRYLDQGKFVADSLRHVFALAIAEEREACAQVAEVLQEWVTNPLVKRAALSIAKEIRSRT